MEQMLTAGIGPLVFLCSSMCCPWDFPGGPVVSTPCSHCSRRGFDPWLENYDLMRLPKSERFSLLAQIFRRCGTSWAVHR